MKPEQEKFGAGLMVSLWLGEHVVPQVNSYYDYVRHSAILCFLSKSAIRLEMLSCPPSVEFRTVSRPLRFSLLFLRCGYLYLVESRNV